MDRYFYDIDVELRPFTMDASGSKILKMYGLVHVLGALFAGYWKVAAYALRQNAKVRNAGSVTYIDAFSSTAAADAFAVLATAR